jgi:hypothetical protein
MRKVTIGRSSRNNKVINDPLVSRIHCEIIQDDYGNFTVIDLNSKNGTFINDLRREKSPLHLNDVVKVGSTTLQWQTYFPGNGGGGTIIGYDKKPDNLLVWSILATIFCCLPLGIFAILESVKVDKLWNANDKNEAYRAAANAKKLLWWAVGIPVVAFVAYIIIVVVLMGGSFASLFGGALLH